jgi:hypothetical protein
LLQYNLPAVHLFLPFGRTFLDEASFRLRSAFPEGYVSSFRSLRAETLCFLKLKYLIRVTPFLSSRFSSLASFTVCLAKKPV